VEQVWNKSGTVEQECNRGTRVEQRSKNGTVEQEWNSGANMEPWNKSGTVEQEWNCGTRVEQEWNKSGTTVKSDLNQITLIFCFRSCETEISENSGFSF